MELSKQIKKYRTSMNLSQEDLAEKIFVTRQTISNWENDKNYPDIHSLLLLSSFFQISLDQLIKGDIQTMKEEIKSEELQAFHRYSVIFTTLLIITIISIVPLALFLGTIGQIISGVLFFITLLFAFKVEKLKTRNNIQTYKEILAFTEGKRLDEIESQKEAAKRPYQKILLMLGSAAITLLVCLFLYFLLHTFIPNF